MRRCTEFAAAQRRARGALRGTAACALALAACGLPPEIMPVEYPVLPLPSTPCVSVVERIQHLDQPSALGFSAVELLARVAGDSDSPLVWLPPQPSSPYLLAYGPESGLSNLRLRVAPAEGDVRYRQELIAVGAPPDTECAEAVLEVPVMVSLHSSAQALDETFPARLEAASVYRARFSHAFLPGSWQGGFAITDLSSLDAQRTFAAGPLSLEVLIWEGGSQGSLSTEITGKLMPKASPAAPEAWPAPPAAGQATQLALWPSAEACPVPTYSSLPSEAKLLGFSVSDVLSSLERAGGQELTWSSGETTALELRFITPASELCQGVGDSLEFETSVRVRSLDGRVDAEVPVQISAAGAGGSIGEISVQSGEAATPPTVVAQATLTGLGKPDPRRYGELRVDLDASFGPAGSSGALTLSRSDPSGPSSSSLGEAGAPLREIAHGRWAH